MGLEQLKAKRAERLAAEGRPSPSSDPVPMDRPVRSRLLSPRRMGVIGLVVAVLLIGIYGLVHFGLQRRVGVDWARLTVATITQGVFHDYIPITGAVQPQVTVYLDVSQGGQVAERLVEEGAMVTAGQPLIRFSQCRLGIAGDLGGGPIGRTSVPIVERQSPDGRRPAAA